MTLLKMYALYKQGSLGDAQGERPGMTDFIARAKWDAWNGLKGTSQESAMQEYLDVLHDQRAQKEKQANRERAPWGAAFKAVIGSSTHPDSADSAASRRAPP